MSRPIVRLPPRADLPDALRVIRVSTFDDDGKAAFARDLALVRHERQPICPILIDSPGGDVYALLSMVDMLATYDGIVATIALGQAMSCGAVLFTCGGAGYRFIAPNATLMMHDVSQEWLGGKVEEQKAAYKESEYLNRRLWQIMAQNIGKPVNHLLDQLKQRGHADWYLRAHEARKLGLANHIGLPLFEVRQRVDPFLGVAADR